MTCYDCEHCIVHDTEWQFSPPFVRFNVSAMCDLVNADGNRAGSHVRLDDAPCKRYKAREHPVRMYPPRTPKMALEGTLWSDVELVQKMQQLESRKIPAQRTMEAFL